MPKILNNKSFSEPLNFEQLKREINEANWPIGRGFIDFTKTDYSNYLGFVWEPELVGLTPVGLDKSKIEFNDVGKVGGSLTHHHTTGDFKLEIPHIPEHYHEFDGIPSSVAAGGNFNRPLNSGGPTNGSRTYRTTPTGGSLPHNHGNTGSASNMGPFKVVNFWKRIK